MLIAARSSQDLACCLRATVSARWKYASTNAEEFDARGLGGRVPIGERDDQLVDGHGHDPLISANASARSNSRALFSHAGMDNVSRSETGRA
jgi:hypothetical protein